ncbi:hypothetical protein [Desulfurispira natronophila]|uniref:Uncharacterized protein n=1 Tax=Desulfurispira natronophila TaxID=682562 RepID=A0A7W7Y5B4_9BACT|nr:hypothetical protein [Desulfurispira natronophila]MBB5022077.1 hypothetical protein [Desulfurispira natronophila]
MITRLAKARLESAIMAVILVKKRRLQWSARIVVLLLFVLMVWLARVINRATAG